MEAGVLILFVWLMPCVSANSLSPDPEQMGSRDWTGMVLVMYVIASVPGFLMTVMTEPRVACWFGMNRLLSL